MSELSGTNGPCQGTVVIVSHDRYFLDQVCDMLFVVEPDRFRVIDGNYFLSGFDDSGLAKEARVEMELTGNSWPKSKEKKSAVSNSKLDANESFIVRLEIEAEIVEAELVSSGFILKWPKKILRRQYHERP